MIKAVLDTNILVSALWTPAGNASNIVSLILSGRIIPCFDQRIINEYRTVLRRPRLAFPQDQVDELLAELTGRGPIITALPSTVPMPDETDRKFYDVARSCEAYLITGNIKHFPEETTIVNPARFLGIFNAGTNN